MTNLVETQRLKTLLSSWLRRLSWGLPGNKCVYDEHLLQLPSLLDVVDRPELNGRQVSDHRLQELAMAPSDGSLEVWQDEETDHICLQAKGSRFMASGTSHDGVLAHIKRYEGDRYVLVYDEVHLAPSAPSGFGAVTFYRAAQAAQAIGLHHIQLFAAGGKSYKTDHCGWWGQPYIGYYSWPCFGFDAPLTEQTRDLLAGTSFDQSGTSLLDVMQWDRSWWKNNGAGCHMTFDLADRSRSWHTLKAYMRGKGYMT